VHRSRRTQHPASLWCVVKMLSVPGVCDSSVDGSKDSVAAVLYGMGSFWKVPGFFDSQSVLDIFRWMMRMIIILQAMFSGDSALYATAGKPLCFMPFRPEIDLHNSGERLMTTTCVFYSVMVYLNVDLLDSISLH